MIHGCTTIIMNQIILSALESSLILAKKLSQKIMLNVFWDSQVLLAHCLKKGKTEYCIALQSSVDVVGCNLK